MIPYLYKNDTNLTKRTINMWLDNLKELKKAKGMTSKQIANATQIPESTIKRIFSGDTDNPYVDTIRRIAIALDSSLDEIFAETKFVVATETLAEVKESAEVLEAEKDLVIAELEMLRAKTTAQEAEILLLKEKLHHKDELLAVYNYFTKIKPTE
jgi:transcriptional regulator with XRE-family HTH domain